MMPTAQDAYTHALRMRIAQHCADYANQLLALLAVLPKGDPRAIACNAGIEDTKAALRRFGLKLEGL